MSAAIQYAIVVVTVVVAFGYAGTKLMPAAWRRAFAGRAAAFARQAGGSDVFARRVEAKLSTGGACGSCDSCKACATPTQAPETVFEGASTRRSIPIRRVS
jgi:hypothetical protein